MLCIWLAGTPVMELTGNPSTIYKGSLLWETDPPPLTRIETAASGRPSWEETFTPGNFPCKAWAALATGTAANSFPDTDETAPVKSFRFEVP